MVTKAEVLGIVARYVDIAATEVRHEAKATVVKPDSRAGICADAGVVKSLHRNCDVWFGSLFDKRWAGKLHLEGGIPFPVLYVCPAHERVRWLPGSKEPVWLSEEARQASLPPDMRKEAR